MKKICCYLLIFFFVCSLIGCFGTAKASEFDSQTTAYAKVTDIISEEEVDPSEEGFGYDMIFQTLELEITSGEHKGEIIQTEHIIDYNYTYNIMVEPGDRVLVYVEEDPDGTLQDVFIAERARQNYLFWLAIAFVLAMGLVGGKKGLQSVVALTITGFAVIRILLPMILQGYNAIVVSTIVCVGIIGVSLLIISGLSRKTFSAVIGTSGGLFIAGLLAYFVGNMAELTGLGSGEAQMLMFIPQNIEFDFQGILFAAIIIGALGAVMDVGMSVSSAMYEVEEAKPHIKTSELMRAGMNVGKDLMGTMANTLILAYTGGAIHLMLLFLAYEIPFAEIINQDMIASEVVRALSGSIGLVFTVPITSLVASTIGRKKAEEVHSPMTEDN